MGNPFNVLPYRQGIEAGASGRRLGDRDRAFVARHVGSPGAGEKDFVG
jgi:hypothetical protein